MNASRRKLAAAALLLCASPLFTSCYRTVRNVDGVEEAIASREVQPTGARVEVAATRSGATVQASAMQRKMCREVIQGTGRPYTERSEEKTSGARGVGFGLLAGGLTLFVLGTVVEPIQEPNETQAQYDSRVKDQQGTWQTAGSVVAGTGLLALIAHRLSPATRVTKTYGEEAPLSRASEPFPCEGTREEPLPFTPVLASFSFERSKSRLDVRGKTDAAGGLRLADGGASLAAAFCGAGHVDVGLEPSAALPTGTTRGQTLRLPVAAPQQAVRIADVSRLGAGAGALALACCGDEARAAAHDACEERCARAGVVEGCLFSRRACALKAARTSEGDATKGLELCQALYGECLVANGTTAANLGSCADACKAARVAQACR